MSFPSYVDLHKHLVQMPTPLRIAAYARYPLLSDHERRSRCGKWEASRFGTVPSENGARLHRADLCAQADRSRREGDCGGRDWVLRRRGGTTPGPSDRLRRSEARTAGSTNSSTTPTQTTELLAIREGKSKRSIRMTLSLAFMSPVLAEAAMEGRLPRGFSIKRLTDLPMLWSEQWRAIGLRAPAQVRAEPG